MGFINKVFGQANPGPVLTAIYTTPVGTHSSANLIVCNCGAFVDTYRISIAVNNAADDLKQYIAFDKQIMANDSHSVGPILLRPGDVVRVYGSVSDISFTIMGTESN